jgi:hypothetical protein
LSRFPGDRGSGLGRFYCINTHVYVDALQVLGVEFGCSLLSCRWDGNSSDLFDPPQTALGSGTLRHRLVTTDELVRIPTTEAFPTDSSSNWHSVCSTELQMLSSLYLLSSVSLFCNDVLTEYVTLCSGFGGLVVSMLVPKIAGSNPAEAVGFFRA